MCVSSAALVHRVPHIAAVHLWNTSIRQAVNTGNAHEALLLFRVMKRTGTQPDNLTFPFVVKACAKLLNPFDALTVHAHVAKSPLQSDIYVQTALVDAYVKCGRIGCAHKVFDEMSVKDVAAWNAMLIGLVQIGSVYEAWSLFRQMGVAGVRPDSVTVVGLTQLASDLRLVGAVHCVGIKIGVGADVSVANTYMSAYSKCGDLRLAELVLGEIEMCSRTVVTWNSMIAGYSFNEKHPEAFSVYKSMLRNGFRPDISTVLALLTSCILPEALQLGKTAHSYGIRAGCDLDTAVMNTLVSMYSKCDEIRSARYVFDSMSLRTCVSWTAMIGGYADIGELDEAWALFYAMRVSNEEPDLVTVLSLISGCGLAGALDIGRWLEDYADSTGLIGNVMVRNALVDMYAKCGSLADARSLFDRMLDRTVVSWTAMITGCALNGEFHQALDLFFEMVESGTSPNHITFLAALQACTHSGLLDEGWQCFNLMTDRYKITPGVDHYTCMVDLLGRRGRLRDALDLIRAMPVDPDAGVWGALLSACKIHRDAELGQVATLELLELEPRSAASYVEMANIYASAQQWDGVASIRARMRSNKVRKFPGKSSVQVEMVESGTSPNHITFLAALQACTHSGLLDEGWQCFNLMTDRYKITPGVDHYTCMVDLLGRRGRLRDALDLIRAMPVDPDAGVWGALLSACKIHRDAELGQVATLELLELEPRSAASYVEMANIYASAQQWDGVASIRARMRSNKVRKFPGKSSVQVDGKSYIFTVDDTSHDQSLMLYEALDGLVTQMRDETEPLQPD